MSEWSDLRQKRSGSRRKRYSGARAMEHSDGRVRTLASILYSFEFIPLAPKEQSSIPETSLVNRFWVLGAVIVRIPD